MSKPKVEKEIAANPGLKNFLKDSGAYPKLKANVAAKKVTKTKKEV